MLARAGRGAVAAPRPGSADRSDAQFKSMAYRYARAGAHARVRSSEAPGAGTHAATRGLSFRVTVRGFWVSVLLPDHRCGRHGQRGSDHVADHAGSAWQAHALPFVNLHRLTRSAASRLQRSMRASCRSRGALQRPANTSGPRPPWHPANTRRSRVPGPACHRPRTLP